MAAELDLLRLEWDSTELVQSGLREVCNSGVLDDGQLALYRNLHEVRCQLFHRLYELVPGLEYHMWGCKTDKEERKFFVKGPEWRLRARELVLVWLGDFITDRLNLGLLSISGRNEGGCYEG